MTSKPFFKAPPGLGPISSYGNPLPQSDAFPTQYGWGPISNNNKIFSHQSHEQLSIPNLLTFVCSC